ncbi:hypothetical protein PWT90_02824 [Aphanocladium album]|nr:hypothetical protein PWT90_02824 [Aphanocladium album]
MIPNLRLLEVFEQSTISSVCNSSTLNFSGTITTLEPDMGPRVEHHLSSASSRRSFRAFAAEMDKLYEWREQYISDRVSDDFLIGAVAGCFATILLTLVARVVSTLRNDVYDLAHWKLNIRVPMQPMWMNMGYWKTPRGEKIHHLDQACATLLREVLRSANLLTGDAVAEKELRRRRSIAILDVGFGCGDQTVEIARALDAPTWQSFRYVGLTLNQAQLSLAYQRIEREIANANRHGVKLWPESFRLFGADAARPETWDRPVRALVDGLADETFHDRWLLGLDCMYHFSPSRTPLLLYAARELKANFMAFDLVLNDKAYFSARMMAKLFGRVTGCPFNAFLTEEKYLEQLVDAGYERETVEFRDVTSDVFSGLVAYIEKQQRSLKPYGIAMGSFGMAKRIFNWIDGTGVLRAVIVVARVKTDDEASRLPSSMLPAVKYAFALCASLVAGIATRTATNGAGVHNLSDETWSLKNEYGNITVPGNFPSYVHLDLLAAGVIEDPLRGFDDINLRWIANQNWTYTSSPLTKLTHGEGLKTWLVFDGLDTFATVIFCDKVIGNAYNQFRSWQFDATSAMRSCKGPPILSINFGSTPNIANAINASEPQPWSKALVAAWTFEVPNRNFVRKQQSDFGWDWSPAFTPTGPWKSGRVVQIRHEKRFHAVNTFVDVYRQGQTNNFAPDQNQPWVVHANIDYIGSLPKHFDIDAIITSTSNLSEILFRGQLSNLQRLNGTIGGTIKIGAAAPKLWWPRGLGRQDMYTLDLAVRGPNGCSLLKSSRRFGFRTILLDAGVTSDEEISQGKQPGNNWHFEINGYPFYVKGANLVPADVFWPRVNVKQMRDMFDSVEHQNLNMLRVWSSGSYLPDFIYDLADERGILLWSEFQFGDALYPDDAHFLENVRQEATENVRRVNHHPSLACWAGGNEIENIVLPIAKALDKDNYLFYVGQYEHLYINTLFRVVAANTRSISYTPSSGNNGWTKIDMSLPIPMVQVYENKTKGHIYGDTEYYNYSAVVAFNESLYPVGRFATEFGFPSMPSLETWRTAINDEDLHFNSSVIVSRNHHYPPGGLVANVSKSLQGMAEMTSAVELYYPLPNKTDPIANFSAWCHATQLFQADFYQNQIQFYRRGSGGKERQRGTLFWQLNDVWQAPTWAALEHGGRWKVLPYYIRRGYESVVVSTSWDFASKNLEIWVASDLWNDVTGQVSMIWVDLEGKPLKENLCFPRKIDFAINSIGSVKLHQSLLTLDSAVHADDALLLLSVEARGQRPSSNSQSTFTHEVTFLPTPPKNAKIRDPGLRLAYESSSGKFTVEATRSVSLYTWLTHPPNVVGFFDENAFVLLPGQKKKIGFILHEDNSNGAFTVRLSQVQCAVLVSVVLFAVETFLVGRMRAFSDAHAAWTLPHVQNATATYYLNSTVIGNASVTHTYNITHLLEEKPRDPAPPGFVSAATLRSFISAAATAAVAYYWNIFLERRLPARPRGTSSAETECKNDTAAAAAMAAGEDNEQVEEQIVKKWIATGRVNRASLNTTNTVTKWLLDISVGRALLQLTARLTSEALHLKQPSEVMKHIPRGVFWDTLRYAIGPNAIGSLLSMMLLPAAQRVLFAVAFSTACSVFYNAIIFLVFPQLLASALGELIAHQLLEGDWMTCRNEHLHELYGSQ